MIHPRVAAGLLGVLALAGCGAGQGLQIEHHPEHASRGASGRPLLSEKAALHGEGPAEAEIKEKLELTRRLQSEGAVKDRRERECKAGGPLPELGQVAYVKEGALYVTPLGLCFQSPTPIVGEQETLPQQERQHVAPVKPPVRFSPDGRWIAYGSSPVVTSLDGGEIVRPLGAELLSWSWVGESDELVGVTEGGGLLLGNPGSSPRRLLPEGWGASSVASAADGEIAVSRTLPHPGGVVHGAASIWTLTVSNPDPSLAYTAPDGIAELKLAQFAPGGSAIVFWVDRLASASLAADGLPLELADLTNTGSPTTLSSGSLAQPADVTDCGDGLAYTVGDSREATREKRVDLASPVTGWLSEELTDASSSTVSPGCSPDGELMAVASGPNKPWTYGTEDRSIELLSLSSDTRSRLTDPPAGASDESPTFIDNARFVLFIRTRGLSHGVQGEGYVIPATPGAKAVGPLFEIGPGSDYYGSYDWNEMLAVQPTPNESSSHSGLPRCQSSQLTAHLGRGGLALGSAGQVLTFTNTSNSTCTLYGFPGLQMLDAAGDPIPTHVHWGASMTVQQLPKRLVTLRPGAPAFFEAGWEDSTGFADRSCPGATKVEITPPGAYTPITVQWKLAPYGGSTIQHLRCGEVTVSPVYSGTAGPYEASE